MQSVVYKPIPAPLKVWSIVMQKGWKRKKIAITGSLSASFAGAVLLGFCCICYRRRKLREWREARGMYCLNILQWQLNQKYMFFL